MEQRHYPNGDIVLHMPDGIKEFYSTKFKVSCLLTLVFCVIVICCFSRFAPWLQSYCHNAYYLKGPLGNCMYSFCSVGEAYSCMFHGFSYTMADVKRSLLVFSMDIIALTSSEWFCKLAAFKNDIVKLCLVYTSTVF